MSRVRSRTRTLALFVALAMPAIVIVPLAASGEPSKKPAAGKSDKGDRDANEKYDPDNITAISQYMETVVKGMERFTAKDYTSAIDTFKKAVALSPKSALAHYALTETYLQQNNLGEAEASVAQALDANDTAKNPAMRARVLFVAAEVYERKKDREKAKAAWQAYFDHASKNADAGFPQTGTERIKVMQKVLDMEKAYVGVRERIAAEKEKDAGKPAAPAKK
jgi:tetratricopeptide (TPR) repeat protein